MTMPLGVPVDPLVKRMTAGDEGLARFGIFLASDSGRADMLIIVVFGAPRAGTLCKVASCASIVRGWQFLTIAASRGSDVRRSRGT